MKPAISIEEFRKIMLEALNEANPPRIIPLSENEKKALRIIWGNPYITHIELASRLGMTEKGSWRLLAVLKRRGWTERVESDEGGYWKIIRQGVQKSKKWKGRII